MAEIRMPKLSPTMELGTIGKWHKKEGDKLEAGDLLLEIATDKATIEHHVLDEGYLRQILVHEGQEASVGAPIALFTESASEKMDAPSIPKKIEKIPEKSSRLRVSPLAKKIAHQEGIDLSRLQGSGPGGRILRRDLPKASKRSEEREEPLSQVRRIVAERLQKAKQEIPHFYLTRDIIADRIVALREELVEAGYSITVNELLVKATALALKAHPEVNSGFQEVRKTILRFGSIDVCVAVSTKNGLITPFVKNCDQKPLLQLSKELKDLVERARLGKLQLHEFQGGSFTISNLGMYGISHFEAIINPPQGAILACGAITQKPIVAENVIQIAKVLTVTLSVDHRVIDGAQGAEFLRTFAKICEKPSQLLL